ncbi:putative ppg3 [Toxoplasma gondii RUB]|uniref:Putative ppg3 n=1 Tax=Toxoplasma gondii RUB TaxID=935652 RepID=A0A086LWT4_TOXGO|nr:putative ppg3 [Toxoplasma gondii RUB]
MSRPTYTFVTLSPSAVSSDVLSSLPGADSPSLSGAATSPTSSALIFSRFSTQIEGPRSVADATRPSAVTIRVGRRPSPLSGSTGAVAPPVSESAALIGRALDDGGERVKAWCGDVLSPLASSSQECCSARLTTTGVTEERAQSRGEQWRKEKDYGCTENVKQSSVPGSLPKSSHETDQDAKSVALSLQKSAPQTRATVPPAPQNLSASSQQSPRLSGCLFRSQAASTTAPPRQAGSLASDNASLDSFFPPPSTHMSASGPPQKKPLSSLVKPLTSSPPSCLESERVSSSSRRRAAAPLAAAPTFSPVCLPAPAFSPPIETRRLSVPEFDGRELPALAQEDAAMMLRDFAALLQRLECLGREGSKGPERPLTSGGRVEATFVETLECEGRQSLREATAWRRRLQEQAIMCASMHARLEYLFTEEKRHVKETEGVGTGDKTHGEADTGDATRDRPQDGCSQFPEVHTNSSDSALCRGKHGVCPETEQAARSSRGASGRGKLRSCDRGGHTDVEGRERNAHVPGAAKTSGERSTVAESNRSRLHLSKLRQDFSRLQHQYERLLLLLDAQVLPFSSRESAPFREAEDRMDPAATPSAREANTTDGDRHDLLQLLDFSHFAGECDDRASRRFARTRSEERPSAVAASGFSQGSARLLGHGGTGSLSGRPSTLRQRTTDAKASSPSFLASSLPLSLPPYPVPPPPHPLFAEVTEDVLLPPLRCGPSRAGPSRPATGCGEGAAASSEGASPSVSFVPSSASLWRPTSLQEVDEHLEETQREEQLEQLRHLEQCVHVLHELHLNLAGDVAAAEEPILTAVDETENACGQVAQANRELVDASLRRSRWWGLQGGGAAAAAGVVVGAAAAGPAGALAGAVIGAVLGAGSGGALRRQHRKKIKKIGERLERRRRRPPLQARGARNGALVEEDDAVEETPEREDREGEGERKERGERHRGQDSVRLERKLGRQGRKARIRERRAEIPEKRERTRGAVPWIPSVAAFGVAAPRLDRVAAPTALHASLQSLSGLSSAGSTTHASEAQLADHADHLSVHFGTSRESLAHSSSSASSAYFARSTLSSRALWGGSSRVEDPPSMLPDSNVSEKQCAPETASLSFSFPFSSGGASAFPPSSSVQRREARGQERRRERSEEATLSVSSRVLSSQRDSAGRRGTEGFDCHARQQGLLRDPERSTGAAKRDGVQEPQPEGTHERERHRGVRELVEQSRREGDAERQSVKGRLSRVPRSSGLPRVSWILRSSGAGLWGAPPASARVAGPKETG